MKQSEIKEGVIYGNGAVLRGVTHLDAFSPRVYYVEGPGQPEKMEWLSTFARWARFRVFQDTTPQKILAMQAQSLRLTSAQQEFLTSRRAWYSLPRAAPVSEAISLSFDVMPNEAQLIRSLEGKGVLRHDKTSKTARLTDLGVVWLLLKKDG